MNRLSSAMTICSTFSLKIPQQHFCFLSNYITKNITKNQQQKKNISSFFFHSKCGGGECTYSPSQTSGKRNTIWGAGAFTNYYKNKINLRNKSLEVEKTLGINHNNYFIKMSKRYKMYDKKTAEKDTQKKNNYEKKKKNITTVDELEWIGTEMSDPIQNYLQNFKSPLSSFFSPKTIAVVGATDREGSVGKTILSNLLNGNKANNEENKMTIYPINSKRETCLGIKCYKSLLALPEEEIDLVVVVTPAKTVASVIKEAAHIHAKSAIIITAGFKEIGEEGRKLEEEIVSISREKNIRIIGPNCLGIMNTHTNLNATFANCMAIKGDIGLISQSGAVCTAVLDWANEKKIGFSSFVSIGSMSDINWGDIIYYLGNDKHTKSILIYMESAGNVSSLLRAAREVALIKPIIVIKCGKTADAAKAAASHTGSLVGSYDVFEAAMKRVGVLIVDSIGDLFNTALVLGKQPRPRGSKVLIVTNAGGPAVLATDSVCTEKCTMAKLSEKTVHTLNTLLPPAWSKANPVDVLGDASAERYAKTLQILLEEEDEDAFDCILIILSPQDVTDPTYTAKCVVDVVTKYHQITEEKKKKKKTIIASWMGGESTKEGLKILNNFGVPTFQFPDEAARTFAHIYKQNKFLETMYEIPDFDVEVNEKNTRKEKAEQIVEYAVNHNHKFLTECKAKQLLKLYGIPVAEMLECKTAEEAEENAEKLGYPIVAKLNSYTITHKSNVKGVILELQNKHEVGEAFRRIHENLLKYGGKEEDFQGIAIQKMVEAGGGIELILGSSIDPSFGHMVLFGSGGIFVEVYKDRALALPPLNSTLAKRLMEETRIYKALQGGQGKRFPSIDIELLANILVKFSQMIVEMTDIIDECEVNPLLVNAQEIRSLDARISLKSKDKPPTPVPIRLYPSQYATLHTLKDGREVRVRAMCAADEPALRSFHENLSSESVHRRYLQNFQLKERIHRQNLISVCCADYDKMIALCAEDRSTGDMLGVCRVQKFLNTKDFAEVKLVVLDDNLQENGLSEILLKNAVHVAKEENIRLLHSLVLRDNRHMVDLLKENNFELKPLPANSNVYEGYLSITK